MVFNLSKKDKNIMAFIRDSAAYKFVLGHKGLSPFSSKWNLSLKHIKTMWNHKH